VTLVSGRRKRVALLGATGSIGRAALDVIGRHPDRFELIALAAHRDSEGLAALCREFRPRYAALADAAGKDALARALAEAGLGIEVLAGPESLAALAAHPDVDCVIAAVVGAAGIPSTLAAARAGKQILLANKETVVSAGALLSEALHQGGGHLLPIDSEHNAVFQCLPAPYTQDPERHGIERIVLTASGGPFRGARRELLESVTPDQACAHPNWRMGRKISVDSATLMNKGLEVIEAHWLFGLSPQKIEVVVHPQSIVHSLVAYRDGSMLAELGHPDMRSALAQALAWPERVAAGVSMLDLVQLGRLEFQRPDRELFPCLNLAYETLAVGGTAPAVLNAANEVAVAAFLERRIGFLGIARVVAETLERVAAGAADDLAAVMAADRSGRRAAETEVHRISGTA
jgi:1-deoxy-D-xylulose-5-phosphate reductoisomerase